LPYGFDAQLQQLGRLPAPALESPMCGRITQKSDPDGLLLSIAASIEPVAEPPSPRFNGAPGQQHWVIRQHPKTGERQLGRLWWGLIPYWVKEAAPRHKPINATAERVASAPMFRAAYAKRRCLVPVDNFFEWAKAKGRGSKEPYAVAMQDGEPFALAGIWESWRHPETDDIVRSFSIITTTANSMIDAIHDRMPVIVPPEAFDRWLSPLEPDPRDLLVPYPPESMTLWPISLRVNKADNDDASILARIGLP
jgi:putative SOS response-associated peptidase YedK